MAPPPSMPAFGLEAQASEQNSAQIDGVHSSTSSSVLRVYQPRSFPETSSFDELRKFQSKLQEIQVTNWRDASVQLSNTSSAADVLNLPIRRHSYADNLEHERGDEKGRKSKIHNWVVTIFKKPGSSQYVRFLFDDKRFQRAQVRALVPVVLNIVRRWPYDLDWQYLRSCGSKLWRRMIVNTAAEITFPGRIQMKYPNLIWHGCRNGCRVFADIPYFDKITGEVKRHKEDVNPETLMALKIPSALPNAVFDMTTAPKFVGSDEAQKRRCRTAQTLCRFLCTQLYARFTTKAELKQLAYEIQETHGIRRKNKTSGFYGGDPFFMIRLNRRTQIVVIYPSRALAGDLSDVLPTITIRTLARRCLAEVTRKIHQVWQATSHPLSAWMAGRLIAHQVNLTLTAGESFYSTCDCKSDEERQLTRHECDRCLRMTECMKLALDDRNDRICSECDAESEKDSIFARHMWSQKDTISDGDWFAIKRLLGIHRYENNYFGESHEAWRDLAQDLVHRATSLSNGGIFIDAYTGIQRSPLANRLCNTTLPRENGRYARHPFQMSFDSVFPAALYKGQARVHTPENIVPTALYLNFGKCGFVPATLQIIANFRRIVVPSPDEVDDFVRRMNDIQSITIMAGLTRASRMSSYSVKTHDGLLLEWRSGKPRPLSRKQRESLDQAMHRVCKNGFASTWAMDDVDRIYKVIHKIQRRFGRTIPSSSDDAPWPFHPKSMPIDWSWKRVEMFFNDRLERMWGVCNRRWDTIDTAETLLLECVWQFCDPACTEFLGLPMVPWFRHPLRVVIAHLHHHQQMRTRWTNPHPSFAQRDDSLNNILFETCISNYMKADFDESFYPAILDDFANIDIPQSFYDPTLKPRVIVGGTDAMSADWSELANDDDFFDGGEDIGDDIVEELNGAEV